MIFFCFPGLAGACFGAGHRARKKPPHKAEAFEPITMEVVVSQFANADIRVGRDIALNPVRFVYDNLKVVLPRFPDVVDERSGERF